MDRLNVSNSPLSARRSGESAEVEDGASSSEGLVRFVLGSGDSVSFLSVFSLSRLRLRPFGNLNGIVSTIAVA